VLCEREPGPLERESLAECGRAARSRRCERFISSARSFFPSLSSHTTSRPAQALPACPVRLSSSSCPAPPAQDASLTFSSSAPPPPTFSPARVAPAPYPPSVHLLLPSLYLLPLLSPFLPPADNFGQSYTISSSGTNSQGNHYDTARRPRTRTRTTVRPPQLLLDAESARADSPPPSSPRSPAPARSRPLLRMLQTRTRTARTPTRTVTARSVRPSPLLASCARFRRLPSR